MAMTENRSHNYYINIILFFCCCCWATRRFPLKFVLIIIIRKYPAWRTQMTKHKTNECSSKKKKNLHIYKPEQLSLMQYIYIFFVIKLIYLWLDCRIAWFSCNEHLTFNFAERLCLAQSEKPVNKTLYGWYAMQWIFTRSRRCRCSWWCVCV